MEKNNKVNVKLTLLNLYILIAKYNNQVEYAKKIKLPVANFAVECVKVFTRFPFCLSSKISSVNLISELKMAIQERTFSKYMRIFLDCEMISKTDSNTRNVMFDFCKILVLKASGTELPKHFENDKVCEIMWQRLVARTGNNLYTVSSLYETLYNKSEVNQKNSL